MKHVPETRKIWTNADDNFSPYGYREYGRAVGKDTITFTGFRETLWRWRDDIQNDFAARMDWCQQSYSAANHPPVALLSHPNRLTVQSGASIHLDASNSSDPDGDNLSFLWFNYPEAGTLEQEVRIGGSENSHDVHFTAPVVQRNESIHFILRVTDKGTPPLSRYQRIIIDVLPD